jgi:hypothetical protein
MTIIALMRLARDDRLTQFGLATIKFSILISRKGFEMVGTPAGRVRGLVVERPFGDRRYRYGPLSKSRGIQKCCETLGGSQIWDGSEIPDGMITF